MLSHPLGGPYHLFAWKQAVEKAYYHDCPYLLAEDGQGTIQGIFPLVLMKPPLLKPVLVSLPFCDYGGVLSTDPGAAQEFVRHALELASSYHAELDVRCMQATPLFQDSPIFGVSNHKVRMVLGLPESPEILWDSFKTKLRTRVRKPKKDGLIFRLGSEEFIDSFYRIFSRNMKDLGSPVHAKKWFIAILEAFGEKAHIGMVYKDDMPISAGIILDCKDTVVIPWSSTLREYNRMSPNMFLYWNFLEHACASGFKYFDFGRSTPGEGTYTFKEQWGAKPEVLFWYTKGQKKGVQAAQSNGGVRKAVEKVWSRLPQAVADLLGPRVRKFIPL